MTDLDYRQLAADLLNQAKACGATDADVVVADGATFSVQVRLSVVDRLTKAREKRLGLRVFLGTRSASASTSDFSKESLDRLVKDTCALAAAVAADEHSGLPAPGELAGRALPALDLYDPVELETEAQIGLARRAEAAAMAVDSRITNSEWADFNSSSGRVILGNSRGFLGEYSSSSFSVSVSPIAVGTNGQGMQRDSWYAVGRKYAGLESPEAVGQEAARRTIRRLGARKVPTQRVPIVFDPETAASLLSNLCSAVSGYAIYKGTSFLIGQVGTRIAPEAVTVYDDALRVGGLGSRPFDGEGLPSRTTTVVQDGVLQTYLLDTYSARKLGLASTASASRGIGDSPSVGPTNFYLNAGDRSPGDILASVKQGLYVTELIGFGINMATGDYSRGAAGLWIENGELTYPVEEITIAGNLKQMFRDIEMVGNDLIFRGRIASPTIKVGGMMIAGN